MSKFLIHGILRLWILISDERLLRGEFKLRYGSNEITSCISHNVSSYELELHLKKLLSITDVSIESIVELYRKSHTIKFSTPNVDVRELKATAIGSSGCEAFICENGPCTKHSITMNANSGLGSFELGQYFRLSLSLVNRTVRYAKGMVMLPQNLSIGKRAREIHTLFKID